VRRASAVAPAWSIFRSFGELRWNGIILVHSRSFLQRENFFPRLIGAPARIADSAWFLPAGSALRFHSGCSNNNTSQQRGKSDGRSKAHRQFRCFPDVPKTSKRLPASPHTRSVRETHLLTMETGLCMAVGGHLCGCGCPESTSDAGFGSAVRKVGADFTQPPGDVVPAGMIEVGIDANPMPVVSSRRRILRGGALRPRFRFICNRRLWGDGCGVRTGDRRPRCAHEATQSRQHLRTRVAAAAIKIQWTDQPCFADGLLPIRR